MNINNPTTFGTPGLSLTTSNAMGTGNALRTGASILVYDATVPSPVAASASAGDTATSARRNHVHVGLAGFDATDPASVGSSAVVGTAAVPPHRDHVHVGLANVVEDTSPQLGGNLDGQNNDLENIGGAGHDWTSSGLTISAANFEFGVSDSTNANVHYRGGSGNVTPIDDNESFTFTMPTGATTALFTLSDINTGEGAVFLQERKNTITKIAGDALFVTTDGGAGGAATIAVTSPTTSNVVTITNRRNTDTGVHLEIIGKVLSATAVA